MLSIQMTTLSAFVETDKNVALFLQLDGSLVIPIIFEKAHAHARPRLNGSAAHWRVKVVVPTGGTNGPRWSVKATRYYYIITEQSIIGNNR
jgi:hypothetical protein